MPHSVSPGHTMYPPPTDPAPVPTARVVTGREGIPAPTPPPPLAKPAEPGTDSVLPATIRVWDDSPFTAASDDGETPLATAIPHSVCPGWIVCGPSACAGAGADTAATTSTTPTSSFRLASMMRPLSSVLDWG